MDPVSPLAHWALDPAILHLNHGSYGGCLRRVLDDAAAFRARMEAAPMTFFVAEWQPALDRARTAFARFVRAPDSRLAFLPSATTGTAIALASAALGPGDEVLVTSQTYRAVANQLARTGAHPVVVAVPLPFDPDELVDRVRRAITPRTRLALLDHVTSGTACIFPIERLLPLFAGIPVLVDGAHAAGQIDLDVGALFALGATWYAGNCHKWLCAPKSAGFLATAEHATARPVITSHGASPEYGPANRYHAELDWPGTHDPSPYLAVPSAIEHVGAAGGGWDALRARNHALALRLRDRLADAMGATPAPLAPDDSFGAMVTVPISLPAPAAQIQLQLLARGCEVPVIDLPGCPLVRLSAHLYTGEADADALATHLRAVGVGVLSRHGRA
ncbi:MAG TPA: aminotransferase class V-fold PLP-dependent enzyme [Kofleriaceae bacterium]